MSTDHLSDKQWHTLLTNGEYDFTDFTVSEPDHVERVLRALQETLLILEETGIWDISTSDVCELMITLDIAGLRLATNVEIGQFQGANATPGDPVVRVVVAELFNARAGLRRDLVAFAAAC